MANKQGGSEHLFVRHVLIVLGLAAVFFLVWQLRILLLMLFGAIVIASIFRAVADMISKYTRLPNGVSTGLAILLVLGLLAEQRFADWIERPAGHRFHECCSGHLERCAAGKPAAVRDAGFSDGVKFRELHAACEAAGNHTDYVVRPMTRRRVPLRCGQ